MSASTSGRSTVGGSAKGKCSSGWAAFDLKQRQKSLIITPDMVFEGYPTLSGTNASQTISNKNEALFEKPFSSVVVTPTKLPSLVDTTYGNKNGREPVGNYCLGNPQTIESEVYQRLKYLHPWADEGLIQDVLAGVNNDVDEALSILQAMCISDNENVEPNGNESFIQDVVAGINNSVDDTSSFLKSMLISDSSVDADASFNVERGYVGEETYASFTIEDSYSKEFKDNLTSTRLLGLITSLPIEPEAEWEEDDIYLIHRKDAISMTRLASRHSKAANGAYLRGDHKAALQFSLKAKEEWAAAQRLNSKAAREILNVRNCENDLWTLDLHGLHAAEAAEALRDRLQIVESLLPPNHRAMSDGVQKESCRHVAASMSSTARHKKMDKIGRQLLPSKQRQKLLQVITGRGNHSRGGAAALPTAIRNFLTENRYHFDEMRVGVITIRPKFWQQQTVNP